jgi:hypothetical protein
MESLIKKIGFLAVLAIGITVVSSACKKETDPTVAEITVVTEQGKRVPFANITLDCESTISKPCQVKRLGKANANGVYTTEFELPMVLKVESYSLFTDTVITGVLPDTVRTIRTDSLCGTTYISIKEATLSRQTVVLYECN